MTTSRNQEETTINSYDHDVDEVPMPDDQDTQESTSSTNGSNLIQNQIEETPEDYLVRGQWQTRSRWPIRNT